MAQYTQKAILSTFQQMLEEMPFEKITVSALVRRCEISSNTFYYHYQDIYDLLEKWFAIKREEWTDLHDWKKSLKGMADSCQSHKKRFYHIYNSLSRNYLERMIFRYEKDVIAEYFDTSLNGMNDDTDKFVNSIADLIDGYITYSVKNL